jgi:hypothetical protein
LALYKTPFMAHQTFLQFFKKYWWWNLTIDVAGVLTELLFVMKFWNDKVFANNMFQVFWILMGALGIHVFILFVMGMVKLLSGNFLIGLLLMIHSIALASSLYIISMSAVMPYIVS